MAEIISTQKKKSGKPDMTPLVDLGFLLITFFIYTTTFTKPSMMEFNTPSSQDEQSNPIKNKNSITVILGEDNRVFWYQKPLAELSNSDIFETSYGSDGIRNIIAENKRKCLNPENWTVIIKPTDKATWQNTIDLLDETFITGSDKKAVIKLTPKELKAFEEFLAME